MSHPNHPLVRLANTDGVLVLSVATDRLTDVEAVTSLVRELRALIGERRERHWLIDFNNTTFFVTPAVNALLMLLRWLRDRGGDLVLTGVTQDVRYVLGLRRLDNLFTISPNVVAGVRDLRREGGDGICDSSAIAG